MGRSLVRGPALPFSGSSTHSAGPQHDLKQTPGPGRADGMGGGGGRGCIWHQGCTEEPLDGRPAARGSLRIHPFPQSFGKHTSVDPLPVLQQRRPVQIPLLGSPHPPHSLQGRMETHAGR